MIWVSKKAIPSYKENIPLGLYFQGLIALINGVPAVVGRVRVPVPATAGGTVGPQNGPWPSDCGFLASCQRHAPAVWQCQVDVDGGLVRRLCMTRWLPESVIKAIEGKHISASWVLARCWRCQGGRVEFESRLGHLAQLFFWASSLLACQDFPR